MIGCLHVWYEGWGKQKLKELFFEPSQEHGWIGEERAGVLSS